MAREVEFVMTHSSSVCRPGRRGSKQRQSALVRGFMVGTAFLVLAGCQHGSQATPTDDPRFVSYDQRHALSLRQQEHTLPLLVGQNASGLTGGDRTALSGFMQSYSAQGEGQLRIRVPQGSANAHAATNALADIHDVVASAGGNPAAIGVEHYQVGDPTAHAPIVVVFDRLEAVTNQCGDWSDIVNPPNQQADYYNFGCASQANFGAMLADPRDLVRPRGVGYPDAGRRAEVLARYRRGEETTTARPADGNGGVAEVELR